MSVLLQHCLEVRNVLRIHRADFSNDRFLTTMQGEGITAAHLRVENDRLRSVITQALAEQAPVDHQI